MMPKKTKGILATVDKETTNHKPSLFRRWFKPREVLIRTDADVRCFRVPAWTQAAAVGTLAAVGLWGVFASGCFFNTARLLSEQDKRARTATQAYQILLGEVNALNGYFEKIADELNSNYAELDRLREMNVPASSVVRKQQFDESVDAEDVENEENAVQERRALLRAQTDAVRARLVELARSPVSAEAGLYKAALQRDLAMADSEVLRDRVRKLESLVSAMQDTQVLAFRKMASVANENINAIENGLNDVGQSLQAAGLGMNSLLGRIRRDKEKTGVGGPFIPAPMPHKGNRLNIALAGLNQRLDKLYDLTALQNALPIGKPISRIRVTSPFGAREDPFQGVPARHEAVDLGGMTGEPVHTTAPGKVIRAGRWGWYGNMVEIDHGLGFRTRYAHMDKILVTKGDAVRTGDQIGTVGSTGRSSGSHLHYEIRVKGYAVDPMSFMKAERNVFKD